jgi:hypothetical protein
MITILVVPLLFISGDIANIMMARSESSCDACRLDSEVLLHLHRNGTSAMIDRCRTRGCKCRWEADIRKYDMAQSQKA